MESTSTDTETVYMDRISRRGVLAAGAVGVAAAVAGALRVSAQTFPMTNQIDEEKAMNMTAPDAPTTSRPTVVLVHGAFADASSWNGVIQRLQALGVPVIAPANPLRGIAADSAYTASLIAQIPGPVIAVGHSYAGAVISNAASMAKNVIGLVFVAAFAPDEGERLGDIGAHDVLAALDWLAAQPGVDAGRIGITGISFGGIMTLLAIGRTDRFRAAVNFAAAAMTWERAPALQAALLDAVRRTTTPLFNIQAQNDFSLAPAYMLGAELARLGKPHETRIYPPNGMTPMEGHGLFSTGIATWSADVERFLVRWLAPA